MIGLLKKSFLGLMILGMSFSVFAADGAPKTGPSSDLDCRVATGRANPSSGDASVAKSADDDKSQADEAKE